MNNKNIVIHAYINTVQQHVISTKDKAILKKYIKYFIPGMSRYRLVLGLKNEE